MEGASFDKLDNFQAEKGSFWVLKSSTGKSKKYLKNSQDIISFH